VTKRQGTKTETPKINIFSAQYIYAMRAAGWPTLSDLRGRKS
jgi:hypothetical protein